MKGLPIHNGRRFARAVTVLTVLTLLVAACGGGTVEEDPASLPPSDDPGSTPSAAGACLEGEPDCVDTGVGSGAGPLPDGAPNSEEPAADGGSGAGSGALVEGGLTVSEALATDGVIAVQGFLLDDGTGARLCEVLAESYPPQCGGASLPVIGYEEMIDIPLINAQGVTWTDQPVSLLGAIANGALVVDPTVGG